MAALRLLIVEDDERIGPTMLRALSSSGHHARTLDFHIAALRRKLDDPDGPSRITTLRGVGHRYEV